MSSSISDVRRALTTLDDRSENLSAVRPFEVNESWSIA
jgi:hypothetical protein